MVVYFYENQAYRPPHPTVYEKSVQIKYMYGVIYVGARMTL